MKGDAARQEMIAVRYRVLRRAARGGTGEVFVATDKSTGQNIALERQLEQEPNPKLTLGAHRTSEERTVSSELPPVTKHDRWVG